MKFKAPIGLVLILISLHANAGQFILQPDSITKSIGKAIDTDSVLESVQIPTTQQQKSINLDSITKELVNSVSNYKIPTYIKPVKIDSLLLLANPFIIELVFEKLPDFTWNNYPDFQTMYYGIKATSIDNALIKPIPVLSPEQFIAGLRNDARTEISRHALDLYTMTFDELPDPAGYSSHFIKTKPVSKVKFVDADNDFNPGRRKLIVRQEELGPWLCKANSLLQFSQNVASDNWYQGGNSTMSVLGMLTGQLNYDNKKFIQWENYGEWRMGFNSVFNDPNALRSVNTNDDNFKINSKLGVKAGGNLFYSGSVDFSTQFFKNYKSLSSTELQSSFLTPVRLNIGMGLDYKYKKLFSVMISPVAYKYIFVNDITNVSPNLFGIQNGDHILSEIGSSLKAQCSVSPFRELQVDSRLNFYTNYEKVEIDWEIVGNFTINRYLSTRLLINPRYDNTVILAAGETAGIQFKELLSFGFAYKLLN
jgi:hypothetical protein